MPLTLQTETGFVSVLRMVLEAEQKRAEKFLEEADLTELLSESHSESECRTSILGYPTRPLYREIGSRLYEWMNTKECPLLTLPVYDLLDEKEYKEIRLSKITAVGQMLESMQSLWSLWSEDEIIHKVHSILSILGKRGLLDLLGLRKTVGSLDCWPPPRSVIEETFRKENKPPSELTVGARALAKHCHRDESSSWWGISTGSEKAKNEHAEKVMKNILDGATWINIHQIVHGVGLVEVRQENGYGARWTCDGESFRGFIEPQMVDGHKVGWKH